MLNVGLLGTGRIGKIHLNNLLSNEKVNVKSIADPYIDEQWAKSLNLDYYTDLNKVLEDNQIQAIFICTPSDTHYELIKKAIKQKKAIFCEKPVDLDLNKILEIKDLIIQNNIFFQVGFNRRFDSNFKKMAEHNKAGKLGKLISTKIISRDPSTPDITYVKSSGGMFLDMTIHDFDILRFVTQKEVKEVFVKAGNFVSDYTQIDIDTAIINLTLEDGSFALIENCRQTNYGYDQRIEMFGTKAKIEFDNKYENSIKISNDLGEMGENPLYFFLQRYEAAYKSELDNFVERLNENKLSDVNIIDSIEATLLALACSKSLEEKRSVKIDEIREEYKI